jgi:hypothetical protein
VRDSSGVELTLHRVNTPTSDSVTTESSPGDTRY